MLNNNFLLIIVYVNLIILSMNVVTFSYFIQNFVMLLFLLNP